MKIRRRIFEIVSSNQLQDKASQAFDLFIVTFIIANVVAVILESVESLRIAHAVFFTDFEKIAVAIFTTEYFIRLWVCVEDERYSSQFFGRVKYLITPLALLDLAAILPFFLAFAGIDLRTLRIFRLFRILRLAKLVRYSNTFQIFIRVMAKKKEEMIITLMLIVFLLILSSSLIYLVEHDVQPKAFSSIPASMWWAIETLTTVGYGDIYPITPLGKILDSIIAILGIGLFALPAGILGSGFIEELAESKRNRKIVCPHCGEVINESGLTHESLITDTGDKENNN